jgi:folylpolyglutamate synthase/dihydropteroate synthase
VHWQEKVEVAVIEVGLGGRLDATNALPNPVVSGISLLDLDHTAILGDTIEKIASEKVSCVRTITTSLQSLTTFSACAGRNPQARYARCHGSSTGA